MQRAAAHEARGYEHAGRGNGRAAEAHFARARELRSAFGNDPVSNAALGVVGAALRGNRSSALHALVRDGGLRRAAEAIAESFRRTYGDEAPRFEFHSGDETHDSIVFQTASGVHMMRLRYNGGVIVEYPRGVQGGRVDDAHDRVADQIVRAYNASLPTRLMSLPRAIDMLAAQLRRVFPGGAPTCSTLGDRVTLADAGRVLELHLGECNGGLVYEFRDAGELPAGNKRGLERDEPAHGAKRRVGYEDGEAAMES